VVWVCVLGVISVVCHHFDVCYVCVVFHSCGVSMFCCVWFGVSVCVCVCGCGCGCVRIICVCFFQIVVRVSFLWKVVLVLGLRVIASNL
jgi:hypothetical protein